MPMKIAEWKERPPALLERLVRVWERSVRATHLFLSEEEIENIKKYVPTALAAVPRLITAQREGTAPVAFMGVDGARLEMLFLAPEERGRGLGRQLLLYGVEIFGVRELAVNEQNPSARGFYEHMGFRVYKRTPLDEQGNPYPLLYMKYGKREDQ